MELTKNQINGFQQRFNKAVYKEFQIIFDCEYNDTSTLKMCYPFHIENFFMTNVPMWIIERADNFEQFKNHAINKALNYCCRKTGRK